MYSHVSGYLKLFTRRYFWIIFLFWDEGKGEYLSDYKYNILFQKSIFNWDQATQGYILGSYYWGYLLTNIPGGILSERYGAKHVVNGGFSVCIISTLITPCLLFYSLGEWKILALLRIICGLGEVTTKTKIISIKFL